MKKLFLVSVLSMLISTPALAERARVVNVEDIYKNVSRQIPQTQRVCKDVEVPVYRKGQASTGDALVGAIIGGAIGNQVGNGSGKDAATVLGAIIGADVANKKGGRDEVVGYRIEQRCDTQTTYFTETLEKYSHSIITFDHEGRTYRLRFEK
jgi:uncharacterized protein YcfJ